MIRLSVIVPFYNVEKYIKQCILSLYDQDIPQNQYEIICIDDCSPDNSSEIIENIKKSYNFTNLSVIHHLTNKKQGGARNTGLNIARGRYIWFVDSDDYVLPNTFQTIVEAAENDDLDILQFDSLVTIPSHRYLYYDSYVINGIDYVCDNIVHWSKRIPQMWKTLFNREFLNKNSLRFEENVQFEDTDFALKAYYKATKVRHIQFYAYMYRINEQSTVHMPDSPSKMFFQVLLMKRVWYLYLTISDCRYRSLIYEYVSKEISSIGYRISALSFVDKIKYLLIVRHNDLCMLRNSTSFKNWLRIKYALNL